jgi:predicted kinase
MKKPSLYIMSGRSFAGKTTLRNELVKRFGFSVASVDQKIDAHKMNVGKMSQDDWDLVYSEMYERAKEHLRKGKVTILDLGNLQKHERDTARAIAKEFNVPHTLIYVNTSEDEVRKRWTDNQQMKGGRILDKDLFEEAQKKFEEPTVSENPIIYNDQMDLDEWIGKNIDDGH